MSNRFTDEELRRYYEYAERQGKNRVLAVQFVVALVFALIQGLFFADAKATEVVTLLITALLCAGAVTTI